MNDQASTEPPLQPYRWYVLTVLLIIYVLNFVDRHIMSILAVDIKADLHLSDGEMGFLGGAAFAVFYALFGIPLGRLADNWGRVRLLSMGLALWSLMTALSGGARNHLMLGSARIGVGVGEATCSPTAYSLMLDYFPKRQRATALSIYSSGMFIGGGLSLFVGATLADRWNRAFPSGGPFGMVGWQFAFFAVGIPGLLAAIWASTLREPTRGSLDGTPSPNAEHPFRLFAADLATIVPPFTLLGAFRAGSKALAINLGFGMMMVMFAWMMILLTGNTEQWCAAGLGYYAVFSWACSLRRRDPATFKLTWGTPAFVCTVLGYGLISLINTALVFWSAPYAETVLLLPKQELALVLGANSAISGFLGIVLGGRIADWLRARNPAGRIIVVIFSVVAPVVPIWIGHMTSDPRLFYSMNFVTGLCLSAGMGAAAASTQDLVLSHMRGTATAAFFLGTTLVGLAFGPYLVGQISDLAGSVVAGRHVGNLRVGILSLIAVAPISLGLLIVAYRTIPEAEATIADRALRAGNDLIL